MSDDIGPTSKTDADASLGGARPHSDDAASATSRAPHDVAEPHLDAGDPSSGGTSTVEATGNGQSAANKGEQPVPLDTASKTWTKIDYSKPRNEVDGALIECMKLKYGETLVADAEDAELLLSYVTRNGIQDDKKVGDDVIQTLINTREQMRSGNFDAKADEAKFRKSYGVIAKAAEPVTVVSLRDSLRTRPFKAWFLGPAEPRKIADIACLIYRRWAFLVLFLLLAGQIYWTATSSVLNKTNLLIAELAKVPTAEYYMDRENERRFASWARINPNAAAAFKQTNPTASPAPTPSEAKPNPNELTLDELTTRIAELNANYSILGKLISPFHWFYFQRDSAGDKEVTPQAKENQSGESAASPASSPASEKIDKEKNQDWTQPPPRADSSIFIPSGFQEDSASRGAVAGQVIDVMQKWFLPLLYGALGAMVFVVRTLSVQARDRLFREEARVTLVLRVFLGMISGLAIGWFWTSGSPSSSTIGGPMSVSTLSPFALAFVAGYGVELFFALLDKIVSTFTNKG
jgi:hypothetical protein